MITEIIRLLQTDKWYNVSEEVEVAKGRYNRVTGIRQFMKQVKRILRYEKGKD